MAKTHWVMDYETMSTFFVGIFMHHKTDEKKVFLVHELQDDLPEFIKFLGDCKLNNEWHISFNGLSFDSQITEAIMQNKRKLLNMTTQERVDFIYNKSQSVINRPNESWPEWPYWKLSIKQVDIYKTNHWDNPNKRSSLKWVMCNMDWPNVQEMPIHHATPVHTWEEISEVVDYCCNDVAATKKIFQLSKPLMDVRAVINRKYGLNCYSYSNTKLGSELLLKMYCESAGKEKREVKMYRTERPVIPIKDILFPYLSFQSPDLIGFHEMLKGKVITNTKNDFKYTLKYKGSEFFYGAGGIHQCIQTGIYLAGDGWIIKDLDVASLYPSIACENDMYPAHLGREFFMVYKGEIVSVRLAEKAKPKAQRDMAIIEGFKEAANATYGELKITILS